jgi:putative permease
MMKRTLGIGAGVMITFLALFMLWQFRIVVMYVVVSLTLAAAFRPMVSRLSGFARRDLLAHVALILEYLLVFGCIGFLLFFTIENAITEIQLLAQTVSAQDAWRLPAWLEGSTFQIALLANLPLLPPPSKLFEALTGAQGELVLPAILGFTLGFGDIVSGSLVIIVMSIYWSINQIHFERLWLSLLPSDQRKQARGIWLTIELNIGEYIRSEVIQSILAGLLLGLGYWLLGSPYPALLALIGALAWFIPVVGALVAVILPLFLGLLTSIQLSLMTTLYTLIVLIALQMWIEPHLFRSKWDNPILTMIIILAMADAFGLFGVLIAPPISAVCQILWNLLFSNRAVSGAAVQVSDLKERQERAWEKIKEMDEPPMALMVSSMERLTRLIEKAEPILQAGLPGEPSGLFQSSQPVSGNGVPSGSIKP